MSGVLNAAAPRLAYGGHPTLEADAMNSRRLTFAMSTLAVCAVASHARAQEARSSWDVTRIGLAWQVPEMAAAVVRTDLVYDARGPRRFDVYRPAGVDEPRGTVIFLNGIGDSPENPQRNWPIYRDWARAVTTRGLVGVLYEAETGHATENVITLLEYLRANGRDHGIDPERLAIFACSAHVTAALPLLVSEGARNLRCAVLYYGGSDVDSLRSDLPVLYVKAQKDGANLNATIDRLWQRAREGSLPWTMVVARDLPHAFDGLDVSDASRAIIGQTLDYWETHLEPLPAPPPNPIERQVNARIYGHEWAEAARMLEPIYAEREGDPDIGRILLQCYRSAQDVAHGLQLAEKLASRHPDRFEFRSSWGALLATAGRPAESLVQLEKAIELGARDLLTHNQAIISALAAGRAANAVVRGEAAVQLFPPSGRDSLQPGLRLRA